VQIETRIDDPDFLAGIVVASGVRVSASPAELASRINALVARRAAEEFPPAQLKDAVRDMLRRVGFKPSGRNKPASEYLAQAAREGRFPRINNLVDINNLLSMESGLPISLLDREAVGERAEIRHGREGESYVFNSAGQAIDLKGLVCICRIEGTQSTPVGNPIKDSMLGKLKDQTRGVVGVIYASGKAIDAAKLRALVDQFADLLQTYGGAESTERLVLPLQER
jgi:DNA/RNA-binding domain of Phe-tRNA-synthetase-like protein